MDTSVLSETDVRMSALVALTPAVPLPTRTDTTVSCSRVTLLFHIDEDTLQVQVPLKKSRLNLNDSSPGSGSRFFLFGLERLLKQNK